MHISVHLDAKRLARRLDAVSARQLPFATSLAVTDLARQVKDAETAALPEVFDRPTPFTMKAFGLTPARKGTPVATVFAKDRQAQYLAPSEVQGMQFLGRGVKIRTPVDIGVNAFGNIPRGRIARLASRAGYFVGTIRGVSALWKRLGRGHLQLLVAFTRPTVVNSHLDFETRARNTVRRNAAEAFAKAFRRALDTAR